jgi:hypothetical protein
MIQQRPGCIPGNEVSDDASYSPVKISILTALLGALMVISGRVIILTPFPQF